MYKIVTSNIIKKVICLIAALALACAAVGCAVAQNETAAAPTASPEAKQSVQATHTASPEETQKSEAELKAQAVRELEELRQSATYGEQFALYFKKYGDVLTTAQADETLAVMEEVLEREKEFLAADYEYANADETFREAFKNGFFRQNIYLLSEELQALVKATLLDGFTLVQSGDGLVPVVDHAALLNRYGELCSKEYREYLEERAAQKPNF